MLGINPESGQFLPIVGGLTRHTELKDTHMEKPRSDILPAHDLNGRGENLPAATGPDPEQMPLSDMHKLIHELKARQNELERENAELRRRQQDHARTQKKVDGLKLLLETADDIGKSSYFFELVGNFLFNCHTFPMDREKLII